MLERLERKHGGTIAAVLAHAATLPRAPRRARGRRGRAGGRGGAPRRGASRELAGGRAALRKARAAAAPKLAAAVRERLAELAMEGASFEIALADREPGPTGADAVEFLIAPNPGVPAGPLREMASGGELSRVMLALMGVAAGASRATLVFDEVDAGIGGQTARAVGEQLRALAAGRQVLCITHLPQIASLATRHFSIAKDTAVEPGAHDGHAARRRRGRRRARADARRRRRGDGAARRHAEELLRAA